MNWFYIVSHQPWLLSRMFIDELISEFRVLLVQIHLLRLHKVPIGLNRQLVWGVHWLFTLFLWLVFIFLVMNRYMHITEHLEILKSIRKMKTTHNFTAQRLPPTE